MHIVHGDVTNGAICVHIVHGDVTNGAVHAHCSWGCD